MSTNLTIKAKRRMDDLVDQHHAEKIVRDDGIIKDLMQQDAEQRQTFEYVKSKKDKANRPFNKNSITFRSRASTLDQDSRTSYRRTLLGKSLEWAN